MQESRVNINFSFCNESLVNLNDNLSSVNFGWKSVNEPEILPPSPLSFSLSLSLTLFLRP